MLSRGAAEPGDPPPPPQELFKKVVPYHCLGSIWSQRDKKGKEHLAPTVRATVTQFNSVANCVITTCLGDRSVSARHRARVVEHWIEVARVCTPSRARRPTPGLSSDLPPGVGGVPHGVPGAPPRASVSSGRGLPPKRGQSRSRQAGPPHGLSPCPPGVPGPQELLLPPRHPLCPAEQLHPPAEEDMGGGLQVGRPLPGGIPSWSSRGPPAGSGVLPQ